MTSKSTKTRTWHDLHIIGHGTDVYRSIWESRETGEWFISLFGSSYEVGTDGSCKELNELGYSTRLG